MSRHARALRLAVCGFALTGATVAQAQISTSAWYTVTNKNSGKCVDAAAAGTANGTVVQQYTCNGSNAQQWQFTATDSGYYRVGTRNSASQVWDVTGTSTADGAKIQLWAYGGGTNQQWQPVSEGGGYYHFVARSTGKCLDVTGVSTADSVQLQQWACSGGPAQSFSLGTGSATPTPTTPPSATATATTGSTATPTTPPTSGLSMLHASGRNIVNAQGQVVHLRGVNLGAWLMFEKWMSPMDSGSLADSYSAYTTLANRFGEATEQSLIRGYQQNWITTTDLDNIKNAGLNCVRVPFWWANLYMLNDQTPTGWRSDAFEMLDWVVNNAGARGIYVILDFHGVVGYQTTWQSSGRVNFNQYWTNSTYQGQTAYAWWQVANHFKGNGTVAMYDLINEPAEAPSNQAVINAQASLYNSVRSADPGHMISIEGTFGSWNWSMLPSPSSMGWTNVVYHFHEYQWNATTMQQVQAGAQNQVNDFNNHASYNCPDLIGEFNHFMAQDADAAWILNNIYTNNNLNWTYWAYKSSSGLVPNSWGLYGPTYWPTTPNLSTDSAATIAADWQQWRTTTSFAKNTHLGM
jgi:aryl-phospho-beta-D-glucosidase BglC (GH1 family)